MLQHEVRTPRGRASVAAGVVDFENHQSAAVADLYPWGSTMAQRAFVGLVFGGQNRFAKKSFEDVVSCSLQVHHDTSES